jgi:ABC-type phosphate transport system substrate-binding protein
LWLLTPIVLAATSVSPARADAPFSTQQCFGSTAWGVGSSLQRVAQLGLDEAGDTSGWAFTFSEVPNSICPQQTGRFDAEPLYLPLGSGAGLAAMCVDGVSFDLNPQTGLPYDFAATDDPPTPTQINQANNCQAAVTRPLALHTIPVAQAALAVLIHLPTGCTIDPADHAATGDRFDMLNQNVESVFSNPAGAATWSTLLPNSPSCTGAVTRVVPYNQSGTAYQAMNYLAQLNSTDQSMWVNASNAFQPQNWPNNGNHIVYSGTTSSNPPGTCPLSGPGGTPPQPGTTEQQPQTASLCNGAGNVARAVGDTPGSIAFVDLATAIPEGFQYPTKGTSSMFWVPLQNNGTATKGATFADPNFDSQGYLSGHATRGANCDTATYTPPTGSDPTLSSWSQVFGSTPNVPLHKYPICTLTYELAWHDSSLAYGDTLSVDARARSVRDYMEYLVGSGQVILSSLNYEELPSNVILLAQRGANAITWTGNN